MFLIFNNLIHYEFIYKIIYINIDILFRDGNIVAGLIFVIIYNVLLVIFAICYIMATFTDPGSPTKVIYIYNVYY